MMKKVEMKLDCNLVSESVLMVPNIEIICTLGKVMAIYLFWWYNNRYLMTITDYELDLHFQ